MAFAYFGAKHKLAKRYPPPAHDTIVEPFAGSAGYAVRHASHVKRVVLIDADVAVVDMWHTLQSMSVADLAALDEELTGERTTNPLLLGMSGSRTFRAGLLGKPQTVTPRMRQDWPHVRRRIAGALQFVESWEITLGSYAGAPDIEATWFVDPPYQPNGTMAGDGYRCSEIDYRHLAEWCRSRRGQVIVCEQSPAAWLPFYPLAKQVHGAGVSSVQRVEVIWRNDAEQLALVGSEAPDLDD